AQKNNMSASRLPPGPSGLPIIGNMRQLGKLPHYALCELSKQYGPVIPALAATKYVACDEKDVGFAPYGDYWRHMMKVYVMNLLSVRKIESFKSVREEEVSIG
ncbi:hypothetical protein KI387_021988, partial [Taxus chinensis]